MKENIHSSPERVSEPASLDAKRAERTAKIDALIEQSSLGTPAAKAIRSRAPREVVDRILARVRELQGMPDATVTPLRRRSGKRETSPPQK